MSRIWTFPPLRRLVNYKKGHLSFPSNAVAALWTFMALLEERKIKKTHENTNAIGIEWSLKVGNACEGIVASFHRFSMSLFYFSTIIYHFLCDTFVFLSFPCYILQCPSLYVSILSLYIHFVSISFHEFTLYCLKFQTFVILHSFPFTSFTMLLLSFTLYSWGQWKASVLGTVFRCSVLGYIQVSYDIFAGVYVQAMCRISVLLLNAWGWQISISSIFSRLPCSELGSPARKQVWKGSEIGWKHLAPTPHLLSPSIHQLHTWKYVSMCTQITFSRDPLVVFGVIIYSLYSISTQPHVF